MWHLVKKEHLFIFLVILTALIVFNYFDLSFNSLATYSEQACINQGYKCCTEGINQHQQFDNSCALNERCYEACSVIKSNEGLKTITSLGVLDFIKNIIIKKEVTGGVINDLSPGQITNDDIAITSLTNLGNYRVELSFDVSSDVHTVGYAYCSVSNWGDGQTSFIGSNFPYNTIHQYSYYGIKNVTINCEIHDISSSDTIYLTTSRSINIPSSVITPSQQAVPSGDIPQIEVIALGYPCYTNSPSTTGLVCAHLNITNKDKFSKCDINWDQNKDTNKWRQLSVYYNTLTDTNNHYPEDNYVSGGIKTVYFKCVGNDGTIIREASKTVQVNLGPINAVGNIENYFRDGLFGSNFGCNAPLGRCNGTTLDNLTDKASCSSKAMCVFHGQCYSPASLVDIKDASNLDYDSSLDKELCVSYNQTPNEFIGSWVDLDIGDSNYETPGQYCEQKFVNNDWIPSTNKWITSNVKCEKANRWSVNNYCDDTATGLSNIGTTGEGVDSNYCCGDDSNEYFKTNGVKSACCASSSATVDVNGNCIGSIIPVSTSPIDIISISTMPENKSLHYSTISIFCKLLTSESSSMVRNCMVSNINNVQCSFTRLTANNVAEFRDCGIGDIIGNVTAQCSVSNSCLSTDSSTRYKTNNLTIVTPKICKKGDTEKDAIIKRLDITDLNLNEDDLEVGSTIKLSIDVSKDESLRRSLDLGLEASIYDLTASKLVVDKKISSTISSRENDKTYKINMTIPQKEFMDEDDIYRLYLKVYESGNEESLCVEYLDGVALSINIKKDNTGEFNDTEERLDKDGDGYNYNIDCNDSNSLINPGASEICNDKVDNNCNGRVDENCVITPPNKELDSDSDGIDDNLELQYFGDLTTANSTSDFDKDGVSDLEEFRLGTNPIDSNVKNGNGLLIIFIILGVLILVVIGYLFIKRNKLKGFNFSSAKNINELENYIRRTLRRGYQKQQISKILITKGWHKSEIENAFKKIEQER